MDVEVDKLKLHPFSKEVFEDLPHEDYNALKNDIQKNGVRMPIEVLPDFTVIDGHQRLKIAKELGMPTLPCIIKDLSESETKEWIITANLLRRHLKPEQRAIAIAKLSELYEIGRGWDGNVKDANSASSSLQKDVLEKTADVTGVSPRTVADYRAYARAIEFKPELKGFPIVTVLNEVKRLEQIQKRKESIATITDYPNLVLGDALEKVDSVPNGIVDMVLIDPPYGLGDIAGRRQTYAIRGNDWLVTYDNDRIWQILDALLQKLKPKLKPNAYIYIFTAWQKWHVLHPIVAKYFKVLNCLIWEKSYPSLGELQGYNFRFTYDMILLASNGEHRHLNWVDEAKPLNIIRIDGSRAFSGKKQHPMEKPTSLLTLLIKYTTVEGELVLDCFAGSGSTLVAAEELNRKWIGIEIDPQWYEIAKTRIHELREECIHGGENDE